MMAPSFQIVIFFLVLVRRALAGDYSPAEVSCFRITPAHSPFQDSELPCLLRGQSATRRDDYTYTPGIGGHKVHTRALTWPQARRTCEEEGGYLAIINSIAESNAITELIEKAGPFTGSVDSNWLFIGFHDLYEEDEYITIHSQTLERAGFSQWADGQPDNYEGIENCGSVFIKGGLNDISCTKKLAFVCETAI